MPVNPKQEFRMLAAVLLVFWLPVAFGSVGTLPALF
jgi:hypothetical protein